MTFRIIRRDCLAVLVEDKERKADAREAALVPGRSSRVYGKAAPIRDLKSRRIITSIAGEGGHCRRNFLFRHIRYTFPQVYE